MDAETKTKFEQWAIVEIMGHTTLAGKVSDESMFGTSLMRVDVPDDNGGFKYTRYFGSSAIYSLTPCTEAVAKAVATQRNQEPPFAYGLPKQLTGETDDPIPSATFREQDDDEDALF